MKSFNLIIRRTHLYLGMLLVPWMFIYAASTLLLNHGPYFRQFRPGPDGWIPLWKTNVAFNLPETQGELRVWAGEILKQHGWAEGPYGVQRQPARVIINAPKFLHPIRLIYRIEAQELAAEQREPSWIETLLRLHFRAGYGQGLSRQFLWGFIVDLVCVSFLVWIATGIYLWWKIPSTRRWGSFALGLGLATFLGILLAL